MPALKGPFVRRTDFGFEHETNGPFRAELSWLFLPGLTAFSKHVKKVFFRDARTLSAHHNSSHRSQ
jgi:hypothetical protein